MVRKILIFMLCFVALTQVNAQNMRKTIKVKVAEAAVTGGFGLYDDPVFGGGASIHYLIGLGRNSQKFKIGVGLREFSYGGKRRQYETANDEYVALLKGGTDSMYIPKMQSNILNGYLALRYKVKRGIDFGANIDIGGITFGGTKKVLFHSYELTLNSDVPYNLKPYGYNLNMFGQQGSWGSSFSEIYFQFRGGNRLQYRVSAAQFYNEIESNTYVTGNGYRFSNLGYMVLGSVVFNIRQGISNRDEMNFYKKHHTRVR